MFEFLGGKSPERAALVTLGALRGLLGSASGATGKKFQEVGNWFNAQGQELAMARTAAEAPEMPQNVSDALYDLMTESTPLDVEVVRSVMDKDGNYKPEDLIYAWLEANPAVAKALPH